MESVGVHMKKKSKISRNGYNKKRRDSSVKVVYISTPMKVKTSASRFRSLVQELTGRDSDTSRFDGGEFDDGIAISSPEVVTTNPTSHDSSIGYPQYRESPTSSDSLLDDVFNSDMVERLEGMFGSSLFCGDYSSQLVNYHA